MNQESKSRFYFEKIAGELTEEQIIVERAEARQSAQTAIDGLMRLKNAGTLRTKGSEAFIDRLITQQAAVVGEEAPIVVHSPAVLAFNPDLTTT